ncbi:hypothetical protein L484_008904 [Morus notabilis]|uniref:Uncharacterized protein n=1 Tax=Morus notabilis TaxID=981085 RepID=W9R4H4_9ROSA|nr:uncharacterized protein LOC21392255 [Morus notabilis]EXB67887.1 hypothetical protein L484_008904 [Morus notabilis]
MQERAKSHETVKHLLSLLRSAWQERDEAQKERDEARNDLQALLNKILALKPMTSDHHDVMIPKLPDFTNFYSPTLVEESDNISGTCYNLINNTNIAAEDHNQRACSSSAAAPMDRLVVEGKALPEKGRLLQAVLEAGPLLQTLLLAPIPQWKNPPPLPLPLPLPDNSFQISPSSLLDAAVSSPAVAGFDHVPQMTSSSSCLDITEQIINSGSGAFNYQLGNGEGLVPDYVVSPNF